jgi:hypothetical protein
MELLSGLIHPAPELIWGLVSRGVGLVFLIAFWSLSSQVLPIAGRDGVLPVSEALRAEARDFSGWRRILYFPTLLWINSSDAALRALIWAGAAGAAATIIGGPYTPLAFAACYLAYLSLDRAMTLIYPWDSMLLEAGLWAVFLPTSELLPQLGTVAAPEPPVAWAFRLLAFRVLFGFGKHKFVGSTPQDSGFLRGFLASQPLPSPPGWFAQKLPLGLLKAGLVGLFVAEMILPFAVFVPGLPAAVAALASIGLMVGIGLSGNFGHFNLIMTVVVLSWLDHQTARQLSLASLATPVGVLFCVHTALSVLGLPFNTFASFTWTLWTPWRRLRLPPLTSLVALARLLAPFRFVHPYGVFPPASPPSARMTPVTEVSWDGIEWHELTHRYWPTNERSAPRFCAPHHERFDQAVVYEGIGLNEMSLYRGIIGRWDPYGHGGVSAPQRFMHRVLAGTLPGDRFYDRSLDRQRGAPRQIRVRTHMLEPASLAEHKARGLWWKRKLVGPHFPPQSLDDMFVEHPLPPPELWHFEDVYWLERSRLGHAMARVARGDDPQRWIAHAAPELAPPIIDQFWNELVPWIAARHRSDWHGLRQSVAELRARYGRPQLYLFERIAARYGALLFAKLEPLFSDAGVRPLWGHTKPTLDVPSLYELRLLTHHIVAQGRTAYDAVIASPRSAAEHAVRMTMFTGHSFQALFRYEALVYQAQKLRLLDAVTKTLGRPEPNAKQRAARERGNAYAKRCFGALVAIDFLKTQFTGDEDILDVPERWPRFEFTPEAEVVCAGTPQRNT